MEVGMRVVRGPDWKWLNQDGGEGHVGSVVEMGKPGNSSTPDKTVVVQWDTGFRTNYRVGYQNAYDLRVLDNASVGMKHPNIICDACKKQGILGTRWKCMKCRDFDLCHMCYLSDKHDLNHLFLRFDSPSSCGVKVPKRAGGVKLEARGIFAHARVTRGPDWDWANQDGGEGHKGTVLDIRGWDNESGRSVANVHWDTGTTNVYRLGHKGKVDLKCIEESAGIHYYRDHLQVLGKQSESADASPATMTQAVFKVGDKVRVDLDVDILKAMQEGHGGWNPRMAEYVGRVGTVHRITDRGDVRVQYDGCTNRWTFHSGALTKVQNFCIGDMVKISEDLKRVRDLQKGHGEWADNMKGALGKTGKILKMYGDGDLRVSVEGQLWTFNPVCCSLVPQQDMNNTMGVHEREEHGSTLTAILEQLLESHMPSREPENLVREAAQGHTDTVREIIVNSPDKVDQKSSGKSALQVASHQGHLDIVKLLVLARTKLELQDEDGDTALHYSAFGNQPQVMEYLLRMDARINALNNGGCSALHVAVNKQHVQCVRVLVQHRCDVNIQDSYGDTALHDAIGKESHEIVELLVNYLGVDFSLKNKRGFNVLHHAALKGNNHATEKIVQKARQIVDRKKDDGFAALHLAALNGHKDVATTLVTVGRANLEVLNNRKQTPLILAVSQGHTALIELLVTNGASVRAQDEDGDTSLHLALMKPATATAPLNPSSAIAQLKSRLDLTGIDCKLAISIACYLLDNGADIAQKNHSGKTSLDVLTDYKVVSWIKKYASKTKPGSSTLGLAQPSTATTICQDCMVCCEIPPSVTFEPCGHKIVCLDCCRRMKKCFVCQKLINVKYGPDGQRVNEDQLMKTGDEARIYEMKRRMQEMEDTITCSICLDRVRTVAFLCGHGACSQCARTLRVCHMCRKPITRKIELFT